ncbi:uncharacterized protein M6G45_009669 isoform 4-T4 [Spheniscus humboldti]
MEKEQHPGQHRNASLGDRIDHWRNVSSSQGSNHCQHEPDPVYTSTSPMHGVKALTSFICANQYAEERDDKVIRNVA